MRFGNAGFFVIGELISNLIGFEPTKGFLHGVAVLNTIARYDIFSLRGIR
jgi:hypothetical protein